MNKTYAKKLSSRIDELQRVLVDHPKDDTLFYLFPPAILSLFTPLAEAERCHNAFAAQLEALLAPLQQRCKWVIEYRPGPRPRRSAKRNQKLLQDDLLWEYYEFLRTGPEKLKLGQAAQRIHERLRNEDGRPQFGLSKVATRKRLLRIQRARRKQR